MLNKAVEISEDAETMEARATMLSIALKTYVNAYRRYAGGDPDTTEEDLKRLLGEARRFLDRLNSLGHVLTWEDEDGRKEGD